MELAVDGFGVFLGKHSERVVVKKEGKVVQEVPFMDLDRVTLLTEKASLSTELLAECAARGIPFTCLNSLGEPYAMVCSPALNGTVRTRREQLLAYADARAVTLAMAIVQSKLANQARVLRYFGKYRKRAAPDVFAHLTEAVKGIEKAENSLSGIQAQHIETARPLLLAVEAQGARFYWQGVQSLLGYDRFPGREHIGTENLVNALLNYGYGVLYGRVWAAVVMAGLEPYAGFIHTDRPGKPALVLDLVEPFRQQVVDRTVFGLLNKGPKLAMEDGRLDGPSKRALLDRLKERLAARTDWDGKRYALENVLHLYSRRVAAFLRGECPVPVWVGEW